MSVAARYTAAFLGLGGLCWTVSANCCLTLYTCTLRSKACWTAGPNIWPRNDRWRAEHFLWKGGLVSYTWCHATVKVDISLPVSLFMKVNAWREPSLRACAWVSAPVIWRDCERARTRWERELPMRPIRAATSLPLLRRSSVILHRGCGQWASGLMASSRIGSKPYYASHFMAAKAVQSLGR